MINDPIYEPIFSDGNSYNMQFVVEYYYRTTKAVFVNSDIASEGYDLLETLSNDENFRFGFASASEVNIKFRLTSDTETYINQANENGFFIFRLYAFTNNNLRIEKVSIDTVQVRDISDNTITPITDYDEFENGWYQKAESIVSADGQYINAKFYDAVKHLGETVRVDSYYNMIYNQAESQTPVADVTSLDLFNAIETAFGLGHFTAGIQYTFNLPSTWTDFSDAVNSTVPIPRNITSNKIFARDLLNWIFELNGLVARVSRKTNGVQFDSGYNMYYCEVVIDVFPMDTTTADKSYNRYLQNQLKVEKERRISQVVCVDRNGTEYSASVGYADTTYQIDSSSNPMVVGMGSNLQTIANNLITVIGGVTYTEIEFETYGDLCVEIGDIVEVTEATSGTTFKTIVNQRQLTGIHRMTDKISLKSSVGGSTSLGTSSAQDDKMDKVEPRGSGTFAMNDCTAEKYSVAVGRGNIVNGQENLVSGYGNTIVSPSNDNLVGGVNNDVKGGGNIVVGFDNNLTGTGSAYGGALGFKNEVYNGGLAPFAIGAENLVSGGVGAVAMGSRLKVNGTPYGVAVGQYNDWQNGDVLEVGNGTADNARSNALRIKSDGTLEAHYTWQLVSESTANSLADLSEIPIPSDIASWASEYYVVVSFPASSTWQSYIDFVIRLPYDYPSVSIGKTNYPFMKGYYYSNSYNACIAVEARGLSGNNPRIGIKTGFSQVTNASATGVYSLTVYYR